MTTESLLSFGDFAAILAAGLAVMIVTREPRRAQNWWLLLGITVSAAGVALDTRELTLPLTHLPSFHAKTLLVRALLPGAWLGFAVTFARQPGQPYQSATIPAVALSFLVPVTLAAIFSRQLVAEVWTENDLGSIITLTSASRALHVLVLGGLLLAMMKIEATFRVSVGTTRWRLKYILLGTAVILGTLIYTRAQSLLFTSHPLRHSGLDAAGLLIGTVFFYVAHRRNAFGACDVVAPKWNVGFSITLFVVGTYLVTVGVLAQAVMMLKNVADFQVKAAAIMLGIAACAILLLSDRVRQKLRAAVANLIGRSAYDFRKVWIQFSRQLSTQVDARGVCSTATRLLSETFQTISARIWLRDGESLTLGASTAACAAEARANETSIRQGWPLSPTPYSLDFAEGPLAEVLRECNPGHFRNGGERLALPLMDHDRVVGIAVLADRVNGEPYTPEELGLLECIGTQIAATLVNLRITKELVQAKELEAFQTMSAFFVHDLKNAASTLNLMLQNLPVHFDNPEFRKDALRGIGNTADRINHLVARLKALRSNLQIRRVPTDLHAIIRAALQNSGPLGNAEVTESFTENAAVLADPEHLESVISNLLLNARDAVADKPGGKISITTQHLDGHIILSIGDNGIGMTQDFLRNSLFRPFSSTKTKGLGIGMFQCKAVVESHKGKIDVTSEQARGTEVRLTLPICPEVKN